MFQAICTNLQQAAQTIHSRESGVHNLTLLRRKIIVISEMHSMIFAINYLLNLSATRFKLHGRTTWSHFEDYSCRLYYSVTIEPFCGTIYVRHIVV